MKQLDFFAVSDRSRPSWCCTACHWRTYSAAPISHEQVRVHHVVTRHALVPVING
jgi:hypothetical protein